MSIEQQLIRSVPAVRAFAGGVLLVQGRLHENLGDPQLIQAVLVATRDGVEPETLVERLSDRWQRGEVERISSALKQCGALVEGPAPSSRSLAHFSVIPQHVGTWAGEWTICDARGNAIQRFTSILRNTIVEDRWLNWLEQSFDGGVLQQQFVGEVATTGLVELKSITPQMQGYRLLVREIEDHLLIEVVNRASGALLGVELVTMRGPESRVRTMQTFKEDGVLQTVVTIVERRTEFVSANASCPGTV